MHPIYQGSDKTTREKLARCNERAHVPQLRPDAAKNKLEKKKTKP